ncbi:MAG: 5'-nucleotidase C-terminal domain-containing protein [Pseudomonadota bacterium]
MRAQKKTLSACLFISFTLFLLACGTVGHISSEHEAGNFQLVVLHTNDTHGHPVRFFNYPAPDVGGLPARATLVRQIREKEKNVLLLDAGDLNTGRPESNLFKATPDILGYNAIGYDAIVLGNHEFDHPLSVLKEQMKMAKFPFLSANVKTKEGLHLVQPYIVKAFDGFKVGILGLTTKETEVVGNPDHISDLLFEDEVEVARGLVPELRKQADLVIALVHMGIYESSQWGSKRLASEVDGIDLIVDGHTHTRLDSPIVVKMGGSNRKTFIVQAWQWGLVLGRVDLEIRKGEIVNLKFRPIPINLKEVETKPDGTKGFRYMGEEIKEDETLVALLKPYVDAADALLSEVVGRSEGTFSNNESRTRETALGDLVADSMLWFTRNLETDFAITNSGAIRTDLPEGPITERLIHEILPFDSSVVVLTLKGSDLEALFNHMATLSPDIGGFPQVSDGLTLTINRLTRRCESLRIKGNPINPHKTYKVATNSYLAGGGDGYVMFLKALHKYDSSVFQRDVLVQYIKSLGRRIEPAIHGRIRTIPRE